MHHIYLAIDLVIPTTPTSKQNKNTKITTNVTIPIYKDYNCLKHDKNKSKRKFSTKLKKDNKTNVKKKLKGNLYIHINLHINILIHNNAAC